LKYKALFMKQLFPLRRIRLLLAFFIVSLFLSGLTVIPATSELRLALAILPEQGLVSDWINTVLKAYTELQAHSGFLLYGYDWLAFAHFVLAGLFIGPWRDPVRNRWVLEFGLGACVLIPPFAFIAGALRGIPFWWQLIDSSFGLIGFAVLWPCYKAVRDFELQAFPPHQNNIHETKIITSARKCFPAHHLYAPACICVCAASVQNACKRGSDRARRSIGLCPGKR
jgi:hypothetical protein